MIYTHRLPPSRRAEQGVVLIVVLVMLVVIAFMSVAVMRGAMANDQITNSNRTQTLATEMAQLALRTCEDEIARILPGGVPQLFNNPVEPASTTPKNGSTTEFVMAWETPGNWIGDTAKAHTLTADMLKSAGSNVAFTPAFRPQCLAEYSPNPDTGQIIVLTARGFSPDYTEDSSNRTQSGSVVWLQSRFVLSSGASSGG